LFRYFRPQNISSSPTNTNTNSISEQDNCADEDDSSDLSNSIFPLSKKNCAESQLTIYSESQNTSFDGEINLKESTTAAAVSKSKPVPLPGSHDEAQKDFSDVTAHTDHSEGEDVQIIDHFPRVTRSSLKISPKRSLPFKSKEKKTNNNTYTSTSDRTCRRQGLCRQSKPSKPTKDKKQKSIKDMFANISK